MPTFRHEGHRLAYTIHGDGPRTVVLVHGLLLSQKMHGPLAKALAERGHRVVTLDLLGHGKSARPRDMTLYSMSFFGEQMIALLDHLELDLWYIEHRSWLLDLRIVWRTIRMVLGGEGLYRGETPAWRDPPRS